VIQGHAIVGGEKVYSCTRLSAVVAKQVARAGKALRELPDLAAGPATESAHGIPVAIVPFRPACRKMAELISAQPQIPRLRDQFDIGERGLGAQGLEECRVRVETVAIPPEHRRQVKSKSVDMHLLDPVLQAIHDEGAYSRVLAIDRVAAAAQVFIEAPIIR